MTPDPATTYRALIRRNYEISIAIAAEPDLDRRFAMREEAFNCSAEIAAAYRTIPADVAAGINQEEYRRAYPMTPQRGSRRTGKANPWRHRTSGRAAS